MKSKESDQDEDELMLFSHFNTTKSKQKTKNTDKNLKDYQSFIVDTSQASTAESNKFYSNPYKNYAGKKKLADKNNQNNDMDTIGKDSKMLNQKLNANQKLIYQKNDFELQTNQDYRNQQLQMRENIMNEIEKETQNNPGFYRTNKVDTNNFKKQHYKEERKYYKTYMNALIKNEQKCSWDDVCEERRLSSTAHQVNKVLKQVFGDNTPYKLKENTVQ